ncbi:MAG TPA: pyrroloquinoline quinone biosynthesis protein PqqB [Polyangia bacterium]
MRVLGSAAGGGFPQWNCGCDNCRAVRAGAPGLRARTQESIAVSGDGEAWFLLNASPEIRAQIEAFPDLWPRAKRHSPIAGILFSNGDLDHCLGLLSLRESHPLVVHATAAMRDGFRQGNVLNRTLERFAGQIDWRVVTLGEEQALGGEATKLRVTALPIAGNLPLHLKTLRAPSPEDNVGYVIRDERTGGRLAYLSGVAGPSPELERAVAGADVVFFDGTFWTSDELPAAGLGTRRAEDMSHWPLSGPGGSLAFLSRLPARRRIFIHVNNTNPMLREDGPERAELARHGVEVAFDGLEVEL